ncbi:MAG: 4Fe-4S dicluster domain-containing protein [Bacteroidales bacterium]|nr:4Fe-4S dicluster domain-containing protein [Bacteroidales bacterium]
MKKGFQIHKHSWLKYLTLLTNSHNMFVPVNNNNIIEYEEYSPELNNLSYFAAKPVTPLKAFLLPIKENVVIEREIHNKNIILGVPACDLKALELLDEIYLDPDHTDTVYNFNRENTILIGSDCYEIQEHCHCVSYNINPWPEVNFDLSLSAINDDFIIFSNSEKGEKLVNEMILNFQLTEAGLDILKKLQEKRNSVKKMLEKKNTRLPDYQHTGALIKKSENDKWEEYSKNCVSCGACAVICPTCTCFLLVDRPDFEKVRQTDACQYLGFERIAAGEDPLKKKYMRFRNRYMCKYVWRPEKYKSIACTGCGRCIDTCIGNINKNEIFIQMASL